jgi:hypothetical protein
MSNFAHHHTRKDMVEFEMNLQETRVMDSALTILCEYGDTNLGLNVGTSAEFLTSSTLLMGYHVVL